MEQHPVPRNISSFQFHLIGDMTLRQFLYLAAGCVTGFIIYKASPFPSLVTFIAIGLVVFTGFAFAFLPIQERPLDRWILAFIRSVLSPTQFIWRKEHAAPPVLATQSFVRIKPLPQMHTEAHIDARKKLEEYLKTLPQQPHQMLNAQENAYVQNTLSLFSTQSTVTIPHPMNHSPSTAPYVSTSPAPSPPMQTSTAAPPPTTQLQPQPIPEIPPAPTQPENVPLPSPAPSPESATRPPQQPIIVSSTQKTPSAQTTNVSQLPNFPHAPNVVAGVVTDMQKRLLPNIIITIKDQKDIPLRALKTNKLGQFASATPLPNGIYALEIEDPMKRYGFPPISFQLTGDVLPPIEIIAKGEKERMREKLARELFGGSAT